MEDEEQIIEVSVLTPAYNAEEFIAETIESILGQTYRDFEYIICDDCSTDGTWGIIQRFALQDSRIIALRNERNLGYGGAFNRMLSVAHGEYIVCQPADDVSLPVRVERQLTFMQKNPEVGVCGAYLQLFSGRHDIAIRKYPTEDAALRRVVFRYMPVSEAVAIVRRRAYDEVGGYDVHLLAADAEMILRIGSKFKLANIPEVLLRNRIHTTSVTNNKLKELELSTLAVRKRYMSGRGYRMSVVDYVYNVLQRATLSMLSPNFRIKLFMWFRDSR